LRVGELLAVQSTVAEAAASPLAPYDPFARERLSADDALSPEGALAGLTVCFTGESVCSVGGHHLTRGDQLRLAAAAGASVADTLTKKVDLLVLADPASQSGKARKAAGYGIRRVAEPVFWRMASVQTD
jgi:DNA polymerase-3 subunit epsilon